MALREHEDEKTWQEVVGERIRFLLNRVGLEGVHMRSETVLAFSYHHAIAES